MSEHSHLMNFNLFKANDNNHSNPYNFNFNATNQRKVSILTNSNNGFHHNNDYYLPPIHQNNITFSSIIHHDETVDNSTTQTAIIINEKMTLPPPPPPPTKTPMHIVSPEAIREALKEEKEELLGHSQRRPFSQYSSFHALKQKRSNDDNNNNHHPSFSIPFSPSPSIQLRNNDDCDDEEIYEEEEEVVVISPVTLLSEEEEEEQEQEITKKEKLKRPPNAYLLFNRDMRRKLLKQSPKMTVAEISKNVGGWWKSLPDDKREYYVKEADLLKQEHLKKYPDFIYTRRSKAELLEAKKSSKLGRKLKVNTIEEVQQQQQEPKTKKRKLALSNGQRDPRGRKKKRHKHPFAPKHPMSAYLYYLASVYPQVSLQFPGSTVGPISKSISQTWHAMTTEEQLPWKQKAEQDKARYAREMQVYMANNNQQRGIDPVDTQDVDLTTLSAVVNMVNNNNKL